MTDTLADNQFATFDEYNEAMREHNRAAASILDQFVGSMRGDDMDAWLKARMWDVYAEQVREWAAAQPEWVR